MAGWAGGQDLRKEIRSFVTRGVPDSAATMGKVEEEINWAEVDDLAPEWDRVESGIDDLLSLSTTYWEPGLGPRAPRKAAGGWVCGSGACAWGGRERRKSCVDRKGMGTGGGKVYVHLMAGRQCKDKICRQTRRRKKSPI